MDTQLIIIVCTLSILVVSDLLHRLFRRARHAFSDKEPELGQVFLDPRTGFVYVEAGGKMLRVNATVTEVSKDTLVIKR